MDDHTLERNLEVIHTELASLTKHLSHLFAVLNLPREKPDDIVGVEYLTQRTGLAEATIIRGGGGVSDIPRARRKPAGWFRGHVDLWLQRQYENVGWLKPRVNRLVRRKKSWPRY